MHAVAKRRNEKADWAIVPIGMLKLAKSATLLTLGFALIHWRNKGLGEVVSRWITHVWLSRSYVDALLVKLSLMRKETIDEFAVGSFVYSVLLFVEGLGLCLRKRWAVISKPTGRQTAGNSTGLGGVRTAGHMEVIRTIARHARVRRERLTRDLTSVRPARGRVE